MYIQKQLGRVWNNYFVDKLVNELKFIQSEFDECVFYHDTTIYTLHTDNFILAGPGENKIDQIIKDLRNVHLDRSVEDTAMFSW